jgi:NAD(P)-dependent dehydrogenase (short-subunit alcohol dehydrogenase family)
VDRLNGKVAVITGGASGIGRATAELFASEGARVVLFDRNTAAGEETVTAIRQASGEVSFVRGDVTIGADAERAIEIARERYGQVDVLMNNAAISVGNSALDIDEPTWDWNFAVVLKGAYHFVRATLPHMRARHQGAIVNIASVNGMLALGEDAYSAAKAGLISFTQNLAVRYGAEGIRANVIAPGTVRTPIWQQQLERTPDVFERLTPWYPLGRVGEPEDIARAALFLASDEASWITGVVLPVDGGLTAGQYRMGSDLQHGR